MDDSGGFCHSKGFSDGLTANGQTGYQRSHSDFEQPSAASKTIPACEYQKDN